MVENVHLYHASKAAALLGVHTATLRNWDRKNQIKSVRAPSGHRLYDVSAYLCRSADGTTVGNDHGSAGGSTDGSGRTATPSRIAYCRVSSRKQEGDLERQCTFLTETDPNLCLIKDIASGTNFKRPGLCGTLFFFPFISLKK